MRARIIGSHFDLQHNRCTLVACGLLLPADLTFEDWADIGRALGGQQNALQWRLGDWWNHPGHAYGERSALVEAEDWAGPAYSTCANAASVAKAFELSRRRESLSFKHHAEVAHLPPHKADALLDWCGGAIACKRQATIRSRAAGGDQPAAGTDDTNPPRRRH